MALTSPLLDRPVESVDEVLDRLREIDRGLDATNGVRCFNHMYVAVTRAVRKACDTGMFANVEFMNQLDVTFANLYLDALRLWFSGDHDRTPKAWAALFERADDYPRVRPLQFALAGMNAHINRDLAVALWHASGDDDPDPFYDDFEKVNGILDKQEAVIKGRLENELARKVDGLLGTADDWVEHFGMKAARCTAWQIGHAFWQLRGAPDAVHHLLSGLDHVVGMAGRGLLVGHGVPAHIDLTLAEQRSGSRHRS